MSMTKKVFSFICSFILVFSMMAPSLVSANPFSGIPLVGTTLTFENLNGNKVNEGNLKVYEISNYVREISYTYDGNGEYFIPNSILKKGKNYVIVYTDVAQKFVYFQPFQGESIVEMNFTKDLLKPFNVKTDNYLTLNGQLLVDLHSSLGFTVPNITSGWNVYVDADASYYWEGTNEEGDFFVYQEKLAKFDVANAQWSTVQASQLHENASFKVGGNSQSFISLNSGGEVKYLKDIVELTVKDGNVVYTSGFLSDFTEAQNQTGIQPFDGEGTYNNGVISTRYLNEFLSGVNVSGLTPQLVYEIKNGDFVKEVSTNSLSSIQLTEPLQPGIYSITLKSHNLNKEIFDLQMDDTFSVLSADSNHLQAPASIQFDPNTKYGVVQNYGSLRIVEKGTDNLIGISSFNGESFKFSVPGRLNPEQTYVVTSELSISNPYNIIYYVQEFTAEQLSQLTTLQLPDNLVPVLVDVENVTGNERLAYSISSGNSSSSILSKFARWNNVGIYVAEGEYSLSLVISTDDSIRLYPTQQVSVSIDNSVVKVSEPEYSKIQFEHENKLLPIVGYPVGEATMMNSELNLNTVYYPKDSSQSYEIGVGKPYVYDTPIIYTVDLKDYNVSTDQTIQLDLNLDNFKFNNVNGGTHQILPTRQNVYIAYEVHSNNARFTDIRELKYFMQGTHFADSSLLEYDGMPIRFIQGSGSLISTYNEWMTLKDSSGNVIFEGYATSSNYGYSYINLPFALENGTYTVSAEVLVDKDQRIEVKDTFVVGSPSAPDTEFISITSPKNNFRTDATSVEVTGEAYENATLTAQLLNAKTSALVEEKVVKADANGQYAVTFANLKDGQYKVVVKNGTKSSEVTFEVDLTPPVTPPPGDGPGGGSGGGGQPAPGGGGAPAPAPAPESGKVEIDKASVASQLTAPSVVVKAPALTADAAKVEVTLPKDVTELLVKNNKELTVQVGDVEVIVPAAVLKQAGDKAVVFTIGLSDEKAPSTTLNAVSETFTFAITADGKEISTFDQAIEVKIPVNTKQVKDVKKVAAYYVNYATNQYEFVVSKYENGYVVLKTKHFSDYVVLEGNKTFSDITNHWAQKEIEQLASKSIINGKTATAFDPNATITRAEFAALISRALNLQKQPVKGTFTDVKSSSLWYAQDVEAAARAGIINGVGDGSFKPSELITREQMATMIVRAIEYVNPSTVSLDAKGIVFADANTIGSYAVTNVNVAASLGVINGIEENGVKYFKPLNKASRAEAAKMLVNMLNNL